MTSFREEVESGEKRIGRERKPFDFFLCFTFSLRRRTARSFKVRQPSLTTALRFGELFLRNFRKRFRGLTIRETCLFPLFYSFPSWPSESSSSEGENEQLGRREEGRTKPFFFFFFFSCFIWNSFNSTVSFPIRCWPYSSFLLSLSDGNPLTASFSFVAFESCRRRDGTRREKTRPNKADGHEKRESPETRRIARGADGKPRIDQAEVGSEKKTAVRVLVEEKAEGNEGGLSHRVERSAFLRDVKPRNEEESLSGKT